MSDCNTNPAADHNDASQEPTTTIPGSFDPALLQRMINEGLFIETAAGLMAAEMPTVPVEHSLVEHEKNLLAAVLIGPGDQRERWGQFRRAIGLRFDEVVPGSIWSQPGLRALALEIDELFRGRRDIAVLNATAIREDLQQRAFDGRFRGSLQQLEVALSEVIAWGNDGIPHPELEFTLACQLFQSAKARALFYPGLRKLLAREQNDSGIDSICDRTANEGRQASPEADKKSAIAAFALGDDFINSSEAKSSPGKQLFKHFFTLHP
jgi:hypothetical protein